MLNPIVSDNFLLKSDLACELYHEHAAILPVVDYHNHLLVKDIAENRTFDTITQLWLDGDHYKWRAMRANGISESFITGDKTDWEKFQKWAETVPYTWRNPLYHWTHLELYKAFGVRNLLNAESAKTIYESANELLRSEQMNVWDILQMFNVSLLCTTNDPIESLEWHQRIIQENPGIKVLPSWRPDKAMDLRNVNLFNQYVTQLEKVTDISISSWEDYLMALKKRHTFFHENGCRLSDHGLEFPFPVQWFTPKQLNVIFNAIRSGNEVSHEKQKVFRSALLYQMALWNYERGWVQQYHIGALRDVNSRGVSQVGVACGFDSIADFNFAQSMGHFFDRLESEQSLTKTIVYNLNPRDNDMVAAMLGTFQDGRVPGKMQYGAAWWFLDQKEGIERHLNTVSNHGLLRRFVGMLTDSRSFLSFSRHEYFRRILCNLLANDVENHELPHDMGILSQIVKDICYYNSINYFDFKFDSL